SNAGPGRHETCQTRKTLSTADCGDVLIENLCGRFFSDARKCDVRVLHIWRFIEMIESNRCRGTLLLSMACPACHALDSGKVGLIDGCDHLNHFSGRFLLWNGIDCKV